MRIFKTDMLRLRVSIRNQKRNLLKSSNNVSAAPLQLIIFELNLKTIFFDELMLNWLERAGRAKRSFSSHTGVHS